MLSAVSRLPFMAEDTRLGFFVLPVAGTGRVADGVTVSRSVGSFVYGLCSCFTLWSKTDRGNERGALAVWVLPLQKKPDRDNRDYAAQPSVSPVR